jgi:hypothetical protein
MTDPVVLHATLSYSAYNLAALQGERLVPEAMYHTAEMIRLLNERLRNPNNYIPSDSTIAGVACLAMSEVLILTLHPLCFFNRLT